MSQQTILSEWRTARKPHKCNYCGGIIQPKERYNRYVGKYDGEIYTWDSHEKCDYVAQEIWEYCDPDEGLGYEEFNEGCSAVCRTFVCPDCEKYDDGDCEHSYCMDKLYYIFQTKELYRVKRDIDYQYWRLRDKKQKGKTRNE